ncbi:sensor histidine kinase [Streptococcus entericus]|uniref:sensor histidine kinase n=1 Tax=Streptococcus entericus TaxID=155680 RepID=UPI00037A9EE3|nr:HAMP domain-containing sensor histidine kinase [Streptococcus entericus]
MRNKWYGQQPKHDESSFKLFFSVFTIIFLVMTMIIIQVLNSGIYGSVDKSLFEARDNINQYVDFQMSLPTMEELTWAILNEKEADNPQDERPKLKPNRYLAANIDVVLYDAKGKIINQMGYMAQPYDFPLDDSRLNVIEQEKILTYWGKEEYYRIITVPVGNLNYPEIAYASILVNTEQLEISNRRTVRVVISVMIFFWVVSLFASIYLAQRTRKPILESFERQKKFVENASHELRTPLTVLQNRLENLFRKPQATILESSESIAASLDEVRNMRLLTTNLLNLARRDDGLTPELTTIQPEFFDTIFTNYQLVADENSKMFKGINRLEHAIRSDKTLLKQLLTILFDNAVKYTTDDGHIILTVSQVEKSLLVEVADNGVGISESDKIKVFDRFYRVDKARTRQTGGFGLGLSLAKQIVHSLGGTIKVRDNQPKGTVFEVKLPLQQMS